jgi:hypothetical protein
LLLHELPTQQAFSTMPQPENVSPSETTFSPAIEQHVDTTQQPDNSTSGMPRLWYGHISMVSHHQNLFGPHMLDEFSTVCKSFFILDVVSQDVHILYFNLFTKVLFYFFHPFSTSVSKRMCVVIELSVSLCRLISIVQILYHSSASNLCLANAFDLLFWYFCSFVVSTKYNHRAIYSERWHDIRYTRNTTMCVLEYYLIFSISS